MKENVIVLGAGAPNGLGGALARKFSSEGLHAIVSGRTLEKVEAVAKEIRANGGSAEALAVDVTSESDQNKLFKHAKSCGETAAVLYNAGNNAHIPFEELTASQYERYWRVGCFGAFLTAQLAIPLLKHQTKGSLMFTGASGSLRGNAGFAHFASSKGALRNLAQSLAREFGPKGIHVAHIIIDGAINGERIQTLYPDIVERLGEHGCLDPEAIAQTFWDTHTQSRSAWTHEVDLRPYSENW